MPGKEKYQARKNDENGENDSSKKALKTGAKAAATAFGSPAAGKAVDAISKTKLGDKVFNKGAEALNKVPGVKKATKKLDDSGALDKADQVVNIAADNPQGAADAANAGASSNNSLKKPNLKDSFNPFSKKNANPEENENNPEKKQEQEEEEAEKEKLQTIFKLFKNSKVLIPIGVFCFCFLMSIALVGTISSASSDGSGKPGGGSQTGEDNCISDNLQASELCALHNQGKYEEWIKKFGPIAQQDYSRTGVFASITMAQAMIESGWACKDIENNLFGIKCNGYSTCKTVTTHEEVNGKTITIDAPFRTYSSIGSSINDHSKFLLDNKMYTSAGVFSASNYKEQAYALKKAGYATSSSYANTLINQIEAYHLDRYDTVVNTTSGSDCSVKTNAIWDIRTIKPTSSDSAFTLKNSNRGQCVWYAQARAVEIAQDLATKGQITNAQAEKIKNTLMSVYGNGGDWYDVTRGKFKGSNNPDDVKPGSIISWKKKGGYGHVAIIEDVNETKKTVTVTEGWATNGNSCPNSWSCVNFRNKTISLDEYRKTYAKYNKGNYTFSGYVYFLEPES